ncbi:hypothetical protein ACFWTE_01675 [Nocardiopsis sp. NPDC058631]
MDSPPTAATTTGPPGPRSAARAHGAQRRLPRPHTPTTHREP